MSIALDTDETRFLTRAFMLIVGTFLAVIYVTFAGLVYMTWWITAPSHKVSDTCRRTPNNSHERHPNT